jgi:hypothetical protein
LPDFFLLPLPNGGAFLDDDGIFFDAGFFLLAMVLL